MNKQLTKIVQLQWTSTTGKLTRKINLWFNLQFFVVTLIISVTKFANAYNEALLGVIRIYGIFCGKIDEIRDMNIAIPFPSRNLD